MRGGGGVGGVQAENACKKTTANYSKVVIIAQQRGREEGLGGGGSRRRSTTRLDLPSEGRWTGLMAHVGRGEEEEEEGRVRRLGGRLEGGVSEYISEDLGLVVLPPGLSSSALKKHQIGTFRRQNARAEGHVRVEPHRNGKILATDPASLGVFSVIFLF